MFITIAYSFNNHASIGEIFTTQKDMIKAHDDWVDRVESPVWEKSSGWTLEDWNNSKLPGYDGDAFVYFNDCIPGMTLTDSSHRKPKLEQMYATKRVVGYEITPEQANQIIADYGDTLMTIPHSELQHDDGSIYAIIQYFNEYGCVMSIHSSEKAMLDHASQVWFTAIESAKWEKPVSEQEDDFLGQSIPYMMIHEEPKEEDGSPFYNTVVGFRVHMKDLYRLT